MKITIYTINDCVFCQQEKDYLKSHNLSFEEKNLETNREFLTEMLTISNNFAGTPVTKIEKDDETVVILKGFTKEEFDDVLGFTAPAAVTTPPMPAVTAAVSVPVAPPAPVVAPVITAPVVTPPAVVAPAPVAPPVVVAPPAVASPAPEPVVAAPATPSHEDITAQIAELQRLQAAMMTQQPAPVAPSAPIVAPVVTPPAVVAPAPVAPPVVVAPPAVASPAPEPVVAAPAPVAAAPATSGSADDSLSSILAELQAKINSQNPPAQPGQSA